MFRDFSFLWGKAEKLLGDTFLFSWFDVPHVSSLVGFCSFHLFWFGEERNQDLGNQKEAWGSGDSHIMLWFIIYHINWGGSLSCTAMVICLDGLQFKKLEYFHFTIKLFPHESTEWCKEEFKEKTVNMEKF